jgi:hypothetical protein
MIGKASLAENGSGGQGHDRVAILDAGAQYGKVASRNSLN